MAVIWTVVKVLEKDGYGVEVSHSIGRYDESVYSVRAGRFVRKEGVAELVLMPFMRAERDRSVLSQATLRAPFAEVIGKLLAEAEEYILIQLRAEHEQYLENRRDRELEDDARGKPRTRHTGKTERNRERRRERQRV
jgi:hypothetical protein